MSRSRKKNPVVSYTSNHASLKRDKRRANKNLRKQTKSILKDMQIGDFDADEYIDLEVEDVSNVFNFSSDGKCWIQENDAYYERVLRK